jgi:hypothetical protein
LFQHTNKFPKSHRLSSAVRIEDMFLNFLESVSLASYRRNKLPLLQAADEHLFRLRILVRFSHVTKFINTGSYEFAAKGLDELGRILGGLIKRHSGGNPPKSN